MSTFWSLFIALATLGTLLGLTWLLIATRKGQRPGDSEQTTGHSFDGIEEYDNPLPRWWFLLFLGTLAFAFGYLLLYPGLGNFKGLLPGYDGGWTQVGQWQREMATADARYGPLFAGYAATPISELARDEKALKIGGRLFANNCAVCHGADAKGAFGFPNLTDDDWLYGGDPETIKTSIMQGRQGVMPAWQAILGDDGVRDVTGYVRSLSNLANPAGITVNLDTGKQLYASNCAMCHGPDGKGLQVLGAPDLTDRVWLYGSSFTQVEQTVRYGRSGQMPAQADFLGNNKVHLLAAYVYSLSQREKAPAEGQKREKD